MSFVHYKFSSKLNYDTVTFNGLHISLGDLKHQIMGREKLKAANCNLQIINAQTKEGVWGRRAWGLGDCPAGSGADRPAVAAACGSCAVLFVARPQGVVCQPGAHPAGVWGDREGKQRWGLSGVGSDNAIRPWWAAVTCVTGLTELFCCSCSSDNYLPICVLDVELGVEEYVVDVRCIVLTKVLVSCNSSRSNDKEMWEDIL